MSAQTTSRLAEYCVWRPSNHAVVVYFSGAVMAEMRELTETAKRTVPGRGAEIGGLLLGSRFLVGGRAVLRVDSTEPIECEYRSGPVLLLSDTDQSRLKEQCAGLAASGAVVAGVYRSHTRDDAEEPCGIADDWRLLDLVAAGGALLLVVRASGSGGIKARMHVRVPGHPVEDTGWLDFPFSGAPFEVEYLPSRARGTPAASRGRTLAAIEAPATERVRPGLRPTAGLRKPLSLWWPVAAGLAGAVCGLTTAYVADRQRGAANTAPAATMAAAMSPEGLTLRWDGTARGLERGATVTVNDGGELRRFELDPSAARAGRMKIAARSAETHVALDGAGVHQTVVVLK